MRISYLIDTDWIIDHFNKVDRVTQKLRELRSEVAGVSRRGRSEADRAGDIAALSLRTGRGMGPPRPQ